MFSYPDRARYDRLLPKSKVYAHAQPGRAMRQRFVREVEEIVWRYKLAPETLNLPAAVEVEEIQVFTIVLRTGELKEDVLRALDRAIPSPLFFEISFHDRVRFTAAYKRPSESAQGKQVVGAYYTTPWQSTAIPRLPLPVALDMAGLYERMLLRHMQASSLGLRPRPGESLTETAERGNLIRTQILVCQRLESRLRRESQFNRKVEINAELRQARAQLDALRA